MPSIYTKKYTTALVGFFQSNDIKSCFVEYGVTASYVREACEIAEIPYTVHFHGFDAFETKYINEYQSDYKKVFRSAYRVIAVSEDMKKQLVKLGANENNIAVVPCGINTELFKPSLSSIKDPNSIIYIGRFTEKKSPINLLKAFQIVAGKFELVKLTMIGDGELFEQAKQFVKTNNLGSQVIFEGVKKPDEVIKFLQGATIFVQHSMFSKTTGDSEGTPGTVLEASASGLPVVSTRHAGIKEAVIENRSGFLVDEGDFEGMAACIIQLIENPELGTKFGLAGRKHMIENYDLDLQIDKLQKNIKSEH